MLKPLGKRVVIRIKQAEQVSSGGLVLASAAKEEPNTGEVVALGNLIEETDVIQVGDYVLFNTYAGTKITQDSEDFIVIDSDEVLAIVG